MVGAMIKESGQVIAIDEDGLWVETLKQSACASCAAKAGCGQNMMSRVLGESNFTHIKADFRQSESFQEWQVGDEVEIGVTERALLLSSIFSYLFPLVGLFVLLGVTVSINENELLAVMSAFVGLVLGGFATNYITRFFNADDFRPLYLGKKLN